MTTTEPTAADMVDEAIGLLRRASEQLGFGDDPEYLLHRQLMRGQTFPITCPAWCVGVHAMVVEYGDGIEHKSAPLLEVGNNLVRLEEHDDGENACIGDEPITLVVASDSLSVESARIVAAALTDAADLYEGRTDRDAEGTT